MRIIDLDTWPRRRHFEIFNSFDYPHFGLCAPVDITKLHAATKQRRASLNLALVYVAARAANAIPELRCRIHRLPGDQPGGPQVQVVEHACVRPSFTVLADETVGGPATSSLPGAGLPGASPSQAIPLPGAETQPAPALPGANSRFGFCTVDYTPDFPTFAGQAQAAMARVRAAPSLEDEPGRDDLLYITAIPWVAFTSLLHPIHMHPADSVPRIAWGKFSPSGKFSPHEDRLSMPLAVQAHHALLDGLHLGRFYEFFQVLLDRPEEWL